MSPNGNRSIQRLRYLSFFFRKILKNFSPAHPCNAPYPRKKPDLICKISVLLSLFLGLTAYSSASEIWRWTDKNNVIHFTDNRLNVPPKYRETARGLNFSSVKVLTGGVAVQSHRPADKEKKGDASQFSKIREELASHLRGEVERDSQIVKWVNNEIAVKKMKELFTKDLKTKSEILKRVVSEESGDLQNELEWLTENISIENQILSAIPNPNPGTVYRFSDIKRSIRKNLEGKKDFLLTLRL